jgi:hypothetical protein
MYVPMTPGLGEHSLDEVRGWPGRPQAPNLRQFVHDVDHLVIRPSREYTADIRAHLADAPAGLVLADTVFFAAGLVCELGGRPWAAYGITAVHGRRGPADRQQERTVRSLQIFTGQVTPTTGARGRSKTC